METAIGRIALGRRMGIGSFDVSEGVLEALALSKRW